jgi:hypothetical protein
MLNGSFTVYSRQGAILPSPITGPTDSSFWLSAGVPSTIVGTGLSDPRIIYDPSSGHWFATEISLGVKPTVSQPNPSNQILVAVSNTANPLDGFKSVYFNSSLANPVTNQYNFGDFPTLGVTPNSVVIGTNNFPSTVAVRGLVTRTAPRSSRCRRATCLLRRRPLPT